ncbi:MAG: phosphoglycerate dehydrogenase [Spirochaetes bacterium]|nr:phosphoglycerate dehydrogenase [Spirochaetota bacterium]
MAKYKVFASDGFSREGIEILEKSGLFDVTVNAKTAREDLLKNIGAYDALIIRSASRADREVVTMGKQLKLVARAGVGLDNVDVPAATEKGIVVMNAPSGNTMSTAELTFAMLLAMSRNIPQAYMSMRQKQWEKKKFEGIEVHGKTLGIVGLGRIGREVAKRAIAFGMKVLAYDPYFPQDKAKTLGVEMSDLTRIYKESDFITVHTPLSAETENLITKKEIALMKPTVRLINCARGGIINEQDLKDALAAKRIAAAALDVYISEPPKEFAYADLENCITTPHLGASTEEAQISVAIETANAIVSYFRDNVPYNSVNFPTVEAHVLKEISAFVDLASKMGSLLAQISKSSVNKVEVTYSGTLTEKPTKMVTISALKGLLSNIIGSEGGVNFVNAPVIAKERGIAVVERNLTKQSDFTEIVAVKVFTDDGKETEVWGTVFSDGNPRIVRFNQYHMEIKPDGCALFIVYRDRPGFVGKVGTIMGEKNININEMRLVRGDDNRALMVMALDCAPTAEVYHQVQTIKDIYEIYPIKF